MDVTQELDTLRATLSGCDLAAFADLSSLMVLCTSADEPPAQEDLDVLCRAAATLLDGDLAADGLTLTGSATAADSSITMTSQETRLYLRAQDGSSEALALICGPDTDVDAALSAARQTLDRIASEE